MCLNVISHTLSLETNTGSYSFVKLLKQIIKVSTAGIAPGTEESNRNVIPNKDLYGMCFYSGGLTQGSFGLKQVQVYLGFTTRTLELNKVTVIEFSSVGLWRKTRSAGVEISKQRHLILDR